MTPAVADGPDWSCSGEPGRSGSEMEVMEERWVRREPLEPMLLPPTLAESGVRPWSLELFRSEDRSMCSFAREKNFPADD